VRVPTQRLKVFTDAVVMEALPDVDRPFESKPANLLLVADVLGHQLVDVRIARLVWARDIELLVGEERWVAASVEVEWPGWWHHLTGRLGRRRAHRRWDAVEPLTNSAEGPMVGRLGAGLARLKPAQIADPLERPGSPHRDTLAETRRSPAAFCRLVRLNPMHLVARAVRPAEPINGANLVVGHRTTP